MLKSALAALLILSPAQALAGLLADNRTAARAGSDMVFADRDGLVGKDSSDRSIAISKFGGCAG